MLAPINYLLDNKSPMDSFVGGMGQIQGLRTTDLTNDNLQHANNQYGLQNEAMAAKQNRQAQFEEEVDALDFNNMQDLRAFAGRYDDIPAIKGVQEAYKQLDDTKKQAMLGAVSRAYAATSKGRPEVAIADLKAQAAAYRNTSDESMAKQAEDMAAFLEQSPEAGLRMLGIGLGAILPKDASDSYANISKTVIGEDDAPVNRAKVVAETGKVGAETNEVVAKTEDSVNTIISNAAVTQNPQYFMGIVERLSDQGLISVTREDSLRAKLSGDDVGAAAAELRSIAMGNPEIAKAFKPTHQFLDRGDSIEGIEWDPLTGETRSTTGVITKGISPNTAATITSNEKIATEKNALAKYTADQQAIIAKYGIDVRAATADAQIEARLQEQDKKNGLVKETKVLPDGRVIMIYNDGTYTQAIDPQTGKPMVSKPAITPATKKAVAEINADTAKNQDLIRVLQKAQALADEGIYSGAGAVGRAKVMNFAFDDADKAQRTMEYNNLITSSALASMKAIFGGNPTEGERQILLEIQASPNYPPEVRNKILSEGIAAANKRIETNNAQARELQGKGGGGQTANPTATKPPYSTVIQPRK